METVHCYILSYIKYKDNDAIIRGFTLEYGFRSFYIRGIYASRNKKKAYLSPLSPLQLTVQKHIKGGDLALVSKIEPIGKYEETSGIGILSLSFFIADFLNQVLKHEGENPMLYMKIEKLREQIANRNFQSHLFFLIEYLKFCGLAPWLSEGVYLNPEKGKFVQGKENSCFSKTISSSWKQILSEHDPYSLIIPMEQRRALLESILYYYKLHYPEFSIPKSLDVLYEVLS